MDHVIANRMKQVFVETCGEFMPNDHYIDQSDAGEKSRVCFNRIYYLYRRDIENQKQEEVRKAKENDFKIQLKI